MLFRHIHIPTTHVTHTTHLTDTTSHIRLISHITHVTHITHTTITHTKIRLRCYSFDIFIYPRLYHTHDSSHTYDLTHTTDGGDRTQNNYDCQNFYKFFTGVPVTFKQVFTGVPEISNRFSRKKTGVPWLYGKTVQSGDPNILSLISAVSGDSYHISHMWLISHIRLSHIQRLGCAAPAVPCGHVSNVNTCHIYE